MKLQKIVETPLSMAQVKRMVGAVPVVLYQDFAKMKSLPPACIYLFLTSYGYGHYCSIFLRNGTLSFFDPYGIAPESEHNFTTPEMLAHLKERNDFLLGMAHRNGWAIEWNRTQLQSWNPKVATCGRHSVVRCRQQAMNTDGYARWLLGVAQQAGTTPDYVVSYLAS